MKVFRVVTDRDGSTTKEPGKTSTEIIREERRFAAETMQEVWDALDWVRNCTDRTLIAIVEEAPSITVLSRGEVSE